MLPTCNRNCQCRRRLRAIVFAVYAFTYVVYDQLHILMTMHDLYTEETMNKHLGLLCLL